MNKWPHSLRNHWDDVLRTWAICLMYTLFGGPMNKPFVFNRFHSWFLISLLKLRWRQWREQEIWMKSFLSLLLSKFPMVTLRHGVYSGRPVRACVGGHVHRRPCGMASYVYVYIYIYIYQLCRIAHLWSQNAITPGRSASRILTKWSPGSMSRSVWAGNSVDH